MLREIADRLGLAETITSPLRDERDPTRVRHSYAEMARTRMLMIAAGYEDCDDVDALRGDPALKIAVGRCPETGADLMSQSTLSRLENLADAGFQVPALSSRPARPSSARGICTQIAANAHL